MIAIVSSTVAPSPLPSHDGVRTTFTPEQRLEHTCGTVASLVELGVKEIFIVDNSAGGWLRGREAALAPARVLHFDHPPIRNKGIGEMWLLLGALPALPDSVPILKISGRYRVGRGTGLALGEADVAAKIYTQGKRREISTRCYLLRNRTVAARLWERTLDEIYAPQTRIVGPRSFWRMLQNSLHPERDAFRHGDPPGSVEAAAYNAIQYLGLRLQPVEHLAVAGILGSWINPPVSE
ncbi:MAG TPA: hypothetical protein VK717_02875 [Opitutaceae bacterium]|jgi:hypothetical protein|nr:hypothetical protein [Opitutaceae bacterium]